MNSHDYVPILKAREAEITSLQTLPPGMNVKPIFELQSVLPPNGKRTKSAATDASYFLDDLERLWPHPHYLDTVRLAQPGMKAPWWKFVEACVSLSQTALSPTPVVGLRDSVADLGAASQLATNAQSAAVRIVMPNANPDSLTSEVAQVAQALGIQVNQLDVVLDWADSLERHRLRDIVANTLKCVHAIKDHAGTVITVGTPNTEQCLQAGDWTFDRREWWLWLHLQNETATVYGDYALFPPAPPVPAGPQYGHLRYSHGDQLSVIRRSRPPTGGGLAAAFSECSVDLIATGTAMNSNFSPADSEINNIASGSVVAGSATKWRQLALGHHLHLVASQLQNPPAPPPPGTP